MTVNPSTMRLGIASILIGLVGAYGVRVMMDEEAPTVAEAAARKVPVPLAGQDLPAGRIVQRGDIALRPMTAAEMEQASMPLNLVMMSADDIVGRQLRKPLRQSEPFLTTSIYLEGEEPSYDLKPGYRAVSVVVSMGRGGYAEAGDVVDVHFTSKAKAADRRTGADAIPQMTIHVASAVTVLEVTRPELNALQARVGYVEKDPSFLLQVEPDLVPKFQALQGYGDYSLMIRPKDDVGGIAKNADGKPMTFAEAMGFPPEEPPQQPPVWPVEIYKRGSRGVQYFPIPQPSPEQIAEYQRQYDEYQQQLAAAGGADPTAADASPADSQPAPTPAPVRQRPTLREPAMPDDAPTASSEPSIPYRASEPPAPRTSAPLPRSGSPLPRSSPLPRTSAPATGPVEEVLP